MEIESRSIETSVSHRGLLPVVTKVGDKCGNTLSDPQLQQQLSHTIFRTPRESEDQDWIKNDVSDCPCQLGSHY